MLFLKFFFYAFEFVELAVRLVRVIKIDSMESYSLESLVKNVESVIYLIRGHFHAICSYLIYVKCSETCDVKNPTLIMRRK